MNDVETFDILVIGGGYIGMELSHAFRLLGTEVMAIESGRQLAARQDPQRSPELTRVCSFELTR
jgi:pyruvate/2-oxoglutarate dehydrogenase complex dihydrolipoamide dehydrogenase (E3) component